MYYLCIILYSSGILATVGQLYILLERIIYVKLVAFTCLYLKEMDQTTPKASYYACLNLISMYPVI